MEQMTTQLSSALLHRSEASAMGYGTNAATTATSNPFDAIIQAMVAQMMEDSPEESAESLLSQAFGSGDDDPLLFANSAMMNVLPSNMLSLLMAKNISPTGELPQEALITALSTGQGSLLTQQLTESPLAQGNTLLSALQTAGSSVTGLTSGFSTGLSEGSTTGISAEAATLLAGIPVSKASYSSAQDNSSTDLMGYQQSFRQTIQNVKQQLKASDAETAAEPLSVDQLQSSTRLTNVGELFAEKTEAAPELPLTDQLTQGIKEHLSLGDSEFTLKLKPESLGEISLKLVKIGGKLTLDITAASSQTARLINSDLSSLRQAVSPMQVEVHEAMTSHAGQNDAQQYSMAGQQFGGGQQSFAHNDRPYYAAEHSGTREETEESAALLTNDPASQLSVYI